MRYAFYINSKPCKVHKNFAWKEGSYRLRRQYICKLRDKERDGSVVTYWFNQQSEDMTWTCTKATHPGKGKAAVSIASVRVGHFEVEVRNNVRRLA